MLRRRSRLCCGTATRRLDRFGKTPLQAFEYQAGHDPTASDGSVRKLLTGGQQPDHRRQPEQTPATANNHQHKPTEAALEPAAGCCVLMSGPRDCDSLWPREYCTPPFWFPKGSFHVLFWRSIFWQPVASSAARVADGTVPTLSHCLRFFFSRLRKAALFIDGDF